MISHSKQIHPTLDSSANARVFRRSEPGPRRTGATFFRPATAKRCAPFSSALPHFLTSWRSWPPRSSSPKAITGSFSEKPPDSPVRPSRSAGRSHVRGPEPDARRVCLSLFHNPRQQDPGHARALDARVSRRAGLRLRHQDRRGHFARLGHPVLCLRRTGDPRDAGAHDRSRPQGARVRRPVRAANFPGWPRRGCFPVFGPLSSLRSRRRSRSRRRAARRRDDSPGFEAGCGDSAHLPA